MSLPSLVAYLVKKKGTVHGKKAFQKYMYFLDAKGVPTTLNFRIHHYGPYSSELDYQSDNLELLGAINMQEKGIGFSITSGNRADEIIKKNQEYINLYAYIIDEVINNLPEDPKTLELWSTTHFIANSLKQFSDDYSKDKVVDEVIKIKHDKFTKAEIEKAFETLKKMKYIN
ncbi:hypothetical protein [Desulforamulus ruminis]|uniref:Antitoxin SocA-like Panacea domain-containing protein n=1 Tax=Desulforamulus ruminis (strain ATCC 23193 / DSM 2154 / NCIMB 8452 / DL) TaxID=696281 RepID=F6DMT0_DESRL|nr:hypothetical protein [Desulforamulus ruminis]AEG58488.1 hypothetical protein Desru_0189 [Desulforamulus ruminis DSM 2154]